MHYSRSETMPLLSNGSFKEARVMRLLGHRESGSHHARNSGSKEQSRSALKDRHLNVIAEL